MERLFFTYWIARHGRENFEKLSTRVCQKLKVPLIIKQKVNLDEYLFNYFAITYYIVALHYFQISIDKICFLIDLAFTPGTCKLFPPKEVLEMQKDNIPEIISYIKKDLILFKNI
jgi:hypothetical protein